MRPHAHVSCFLYAIIIRLKIAHRRTILDLQENLKAFCILARPRRELFVNTYEPSGTGMSYLALSFSVIPLVVEPNNERVKFRRPI